MYVFDKQKPYNFTEIAAIDCPQAPVVQKYVILYVQLFYSYKECPLVLQFINLYHFTFRYAHRSTPGAEFMSIGVIPSPVDNMIRHYELDIANPDKQTANYNYVRKSAYERQNPIFKTKIPLEEDFAVVLLNTEKFSGVQTMPDMLHPLRYIARKETSMKDHAVIKDESVINFVLETAEDAFIFSANTDKLNQHSFAKRLSNTLQKPIYKYNPRSDITQSINVCGTELKMGLPSPGKTNNCDGNTLPILHGQNFVVSDTSPETLSNEESAASATESVEPVVVSDGSTGAIAAVNEYAEEEVQIVNQNERILPSVSNEEHEVIMIDEPAVNSVLQPSGKNEK